MLRVPRVYHIVQTKLHRNRECWRQAGLVRLKAGARRPCIVEASIYALSHCRGVTPLEERRVLNHTSTALSLCSMSAPVISCLWLRALREANRPPTKSPPFAKKLSVHWSMLLCREQPNQSIHRLERNTRHQLGKRKLKILQEGQRNLRRTSWQTPRGYKAVGRALYRSSTAFRSQNAAPCSGSIH